MKNSDDTIGNGTRDLPVCSAVPQPTAPPRAPNGRKFLFELNDTVAKWLEVHAVGQADGISMTWMKLPVNRTIPHSCWKTSDGSSGLKGSLR